MLVTAAGEWGIDLGRSFMIGDRWRDVDAGASAGCRTVFLDFGYAEKGPQAPPSITVSNLRQGVDWVLADG
jgi:D-glycero-D-manno-heptose 1,7-bisphosphate phosphatase